MYKDLPLMDIDFGVSQLSGNKGLLISLLCKFNQEYTNAPQKLSRLVEQEDLASAKVFVHTVKGVSGNLGMKALAQISKELEMLYREGNTDAELQSTFIDILGKTIAFNESLADEATSSGAMSANDNESSEKLIGLLKQNAFISKDVLDELLATIDLPASDKEALYQAIDDLEYPTALKLMGVDV